MEYLKYYFMKEKMTLTSKKITLKKPVKLPVKGSQVLVYKISLFLIDQKIKKKIKIYKIKIKFNDIFIIKNYNIFIIL